jgi:hypothetical protein
LLKKEKLKWVKSTYGHCVYQYMRGEHVIATISPIENKEGKIVWQYNIFTGKPRLITSENSSAKYSHLGIYLADLHYYQCELKKCRKT